MSKNSKKILIGISLVFLGWLMANNTQIRHSNYLAQEIISSCEGIEDFYTGMSFGFDVEILQNRIQRCREITGNRVNDTFISEYIILYSPKDLKNCGDKRIDCEDASFFIGCLAKKYNITCEYISYWGVNIPSHVGVQCLINKEWERFY